MNQRAKEEERLLRQQSTSTDHMKGAGNHQLTEAQKEEPLGHWPPSLLAIGRKRSAAAEASLPARGTRCIWRWIHLGEIPVRPRGGHDRHVQSTSLESATTLAMAAIGLLQRRPRRMVDVISLVIEDNNGERYLRG
jgi:hypothetical protein